MISEFLKIQKIWEIQKILTSRYNYLRAQPCMQHTVMQNTPLAEIPDAKQASIPNTPNTTIPEYGSIDLQFAGRKLTALEKDAAQNAVKSSKHTYLQALPNHAVNESGMLQGFVFSCDTSDKACVLPMTEEMFSMTTVYECSGNAMRSTFNKNALRITANLGHYVEKLMSLRDDLTHLDQPRARFTCIPDVDDMINDEDYHENRFEDEDWWQPSMPCRVGVYHGFRQSMERDARQHTLYIVVSGCETYAANELYNLWQDSATHMTAKQFVESEEVEWLRRCTLRSQQRVAAMVAQNFELDVPLTNDFLSPRKDSIAVPIVQTFTHDILHDATNDRILQTNHATFLHNTKNGVAFDVFSSEGVWLFQGPTDNTNFYEYGGVFRRSTQAVAFPSSSVRFHSQYIPQGDCRVASQFMRDMSEHCDALPGAQDGCDECSNYNEYNAASAYEKEYARQSEEQIRSSLKKVYEAYEQKYMDPEAEQLMYELPDSPRSRQSSNDSHDSHASNDSQDLSGLDNSTVEHAHTDVSFKQESCIWHKHEHLICGNQKITGGPGEEDHNHQQNCSNVHNGIILTDISKHKGRYMYPDEMFLQSLQQLGFDRNDGVVILMPLCVIYNDDKSNT